MNQYEPLWKFVQEKAVPQLTLSFAEVEAIIGIPIDHSFLNAKKELLQYGYQVGKISLKGKTVRFHQLDT